MLVQNILISARLDAPAYAMLMSDSHIRILRQPGERWGRRSAPDLVRAVRYAHFRPLVRSMLAYRC